MLPSSSFKLNWDVTYQEFPNQKVQLTLRFKHEIIKVFTLIISWFKLREIRRKNLSNTRGRLRLVTICYEDYVTTCTSNHSIVVDIKLKGLQGKHEP